MLTNILHTDYLILFAVMGIGIILGNIKIYGFSLGSSAVIIVALPVGYFYSVYGTIINIPPIVQNIGLVLFIYTIGIQSGPSFFNILKKNGIKFIAIGILPTILGAILTLLILLIFKNINPNIIIGIFTGALTSTPGLASIKEATGSSLSIIGYSIAYPFGTIGIIIFIKIAPKIFKINLKKEEENYLEEVYKESPELKSKKFIVENNYFVGKTLKQAHFRRKTGCNVSRIIKSNTGEVVSGINDEVIAKNDILIVVGTIDNLDNAHAFIGKEIKTRIKENLGKYMVNWFYVTKENMIDKPLSLLKLTEYFKAVIIRLKRSGIELTPDKNTRLRFGDRIQLSYPKNNEIQIKNLFGNNIAKMGSISFLTVGIGASLGILIGFIPFHIFGTTFTIGITGGVLIISILLSNKGKTGNIIWSLSGSSSNLLRELGLLLFLIPIGLSGGGQLRSILSNYGFVLFLVGALMTILIPYISVIIGKYIFKMNMLTLLGIVSAGMTSTVALSGIDNMTKTNAHKIAYAATYPFATISVIFISHFLAILVKNLLNI